MTECITIPFLPEFKEKLLNGEKTATSRTRKYGNGGDLFSAFGHTFRITKVDKVYLGDVCSFYQQEGCNSQNEFIDIWNKIHPRKSYRFDTLVWLHQFKRVT